MSQSVTTCGGTTGIKLFSGRISTGTSLPQDLSVCYVMRCSDGKIFQAKKTSGGKSWEQVNISANTPFIFYDVFNETIYRFNMGSSGGGGSSGNGGSTTRPVSQSLQGQTRQAVSGLPIVSPFQSSTSVVMSGRATPFSQQSQTGVDGQVSAVLSSAGAVSTSGSIPPTAVGAGSGGGADDIVFGSVEGDSTIAIVQSTGSGTTSGATAAGRATAQSSILAAGDGSLSKGSASDSSTILAAENGSSAMGDASGGSMVSAAAKGTKAHGRAGLYSGIRAGYTEGEDIPMKGLPQRYQFVVQRGNTGPVLSAGAGGVRAADLTTEKVVFSQVSNTGCTPSEVMLTNINPPQQEVLRFYSSQHNIGPFLGSFAPGYGDGSTAAGVAENDAFVMSAADGALAQGTAECGRVHLAAGKGSAVLGSNNIALAPQSFAFGKHGLAYMAGSSVHSSFEPSTNTVVPDDCIGTCQNITVMTKGSTTSMRDPPSGTQTGFLLTTIFALADSPESPIIVTPNGDTVDTTKVPFLHCPGTAYVEATLVSPALIGSRNQDLGPAIAAKYGFVVSRSDFNSQSSHDITGLTKLYSFPQDIQNIITVSVEPSTGLNEGFSFIVKEFLPLQIDGVNNPRLRFGGQDGDTPGYPIMGRLYSVYFNITFNATGYTLVTETVRSTLLGAGSGGDDGKSSCSRCHGSTHKRRTCYSCDKGDSLI